MRLLTLLFLPHIIIWLLTRSRRAFRWLMIFAALTVQLFSLLPVVIIVYAVANEPETEQPTIMRSALSYPVLPADYPLRISWYDPSMGGTNCDSDCSTMASGDKVASWLGGRGGIYAAACPRSNGWYHGLRFVLDGTVYECRDTGGWINCYQPGMYDPALKRQADTSYCWVDLLNNSQYGYGNLAHNWGFAK